jgi:hypothetical protein
MWMRKRTKVWLIDRTRSTKEVEQSHVDLHDFLLALLQQWYEFIAERVEEIVKAAKPLQTLWVDVAFRDWKAFITDLNPTAAETLSAAQQHDALRRAVVLCQRAPSQAAVRTNTQTRCIALLSAAILPFRSLVCS